MCPSDASFMQFIDKLYQIWTYIFDSGSKVNANVQPQPAHNVVLRLILGRDVEQPIFNIESTLLISTSGKQQIFNWNNVRFQHWNNVRFQRWNNVRYQRWNVWFQRWNNVIFQRLFVLTKSNAFSTLKFDVVSTCIACWDVIVTL